VASVMSQWEADHSLNFCLLGPGGIGKTAIALHLLHHERVVSFYQKERYFLACDTLVSGTADALLLALLEIFKIHSQPYKDRLTLLSKWVLSGKQMMVVLDNF
jgi:hypothetical protein